jgi:predicted ribosomally synthesized peptide with SipW-like signal peptide
MQVQDKRASTRRKVFAIAAGGAVLGLGVSATLAAWTDTEWVFGGDGTGGPGIGTSTFEVQQSTEAPFTAFTDEEDNPGGEVVFEVDAGSLTPGDSVYAQIALQTAPDSIAGDVELQAAVPAAGLPDEDPAGLLFDALDVRVVTDDAVFAACDDTAFAAPGADIIADGPLATAGGTSLQALDAAAGSTQYYCFEITLPDPLPLAPGTDADDYMGLAVAPAWEFTAES